MKKLCTSLFCLCLLSACVSLPREEIIHDEQNTTKLTEITADIEENIANNQDYIKCVAQVDKLNNIVKKDKLNKEDYSFVYEVFLANNSYIEPINCLDYLDIEYNKYKESFMNYCEDRYWHENLLVSTLLLPIRLTNVTLSLGTLGIWCVTSMCESQYSNLARKEGIKDPESQSSTAGFNPWAPGDDWNKDICKSMFPTQEDFLQNQNLASFTNVEKLNTQIEEYLNRERAAKEAAIKAERQKKQKIEAERKRKQAEECKKNPACREQAIRMRARMACSEELTRCSRQCAFDYSGVEYMKQQCMDSCRIIFNKCQQQ